MNLKDAARELIEAKTKTERERLLKNIPEKDLLELTYAVKEICYSFWTSEPTKAQSSAKALQIIYKLHPQTEIKAYLEWVSGIAEITRGNLTLAIKQLDKAAATFLHFENEHAAGQTQVAKLYALALLGFYDEAVKTGDKALKIFEKYNDEIAAGKIENNLGNIFIRQELPDQAKKYYLSARIRFAKLKDAEQLMLSEIGLANAYSLLNDFRGAERFYHKSLANARITGMLLRQAEIEINMGNFAMLRGRYDEALKYLELSRRKYEVLRMPH